MYDHRVLCWAEHSSEPYFRAVGYFYWPPYSTPRRAAYAGRCILHRCGSSRILIGQRENVPESKRDTTKRISPALGGAPLAKKGSRARPVLEHLSMPSRLESWERTFMQCTKKTMQKNTLLLACSDDAKTPILVAKCSFVIKLRKHASANNKACRFH